MNNNPNKKSSESQSVQILTHLMKGKKITALDAMSLFGCMRLASRINELRTKGYPIEDRWVVTSRTKKRVKQYFMIKK